MALLHGRNIIERDIFESRNERTEPFLNFILRSCAHRSQSAAVKRLVGGDDFGFAFLSPVDKKPSRNLNGSFGGLGSAVTEKNLVAETQSGDFRREPRLRFDMKPVGDVEQLPGLLADRLNDFRMTMTEAVHRHACDKIEKLVSRCVPDIHALAFNESDGIPSHKWQRHVARSAE